MRLAMEVEDLRRFSPIGQGQDHGTAGLGVKRRRG